MKREDFEKWQPAGYSGELCNIEKVVFENGLNICIGGVTFHFEHYASFSVTDESFTDGFWITEREKAWNFYKSEQSEYINKLKEISILFRETITMPIHYVFVGIASVLHVVSDIEPNIMGTFKKQ